MKILIQNFLIGFLVGIICRLLELPFWLAVIAALVLLVLSKPDEPAE